MAKAKKSTKELLKWKKKKWVKIVAPKNFRNAPLGESLVMNAESLLGKTVDTNLMTITGDMKKQNLNVKFLINEIKDAQANTRLMSYKISNAAVKRMVRRSRARIDHSFTCKTKDGIEVRIKPLMITVNNTSQSVLTMIRKKTEHLLKTHASKSKYDDLMNDTVAHKIQNELRKQLKELFPMRTCEIRWIHVVKKDTIMGVGKPAVKKVKVEESVEKVAEEKAEATPKADEKPAKKTAEKKEEKAEETKKEE